MSLDNLYFKKKKINKRQKTRKKEIAKALNIIEEINKLIKIITRKSE